MKEPKQPPIDNPQKELETCSDFLAQIKKNNPQAKPLGPKPDFQALQARVFEQIKQQPKLWYQQPKLWLAAASLVLSLGLMLFWSHSKQSSNELAQANPNLNWSEDLEHTQVRAWLEEQVEDWEDEDLLSLLPNPSPRPKNQLPALEAEWLLDELEDEDLLDLF